LAELFQSDAVPEVEVRRGGVGSQFDAERAAQREFFSEFFFAMNLDGAALEEGELIGNGSHGCCAGAGAVKLRW
jgi:hypothetical protein